MAEVDINAGRKDIEHGLGLLVSLVSILRDAEFDTSQAVLALAQKAGGLIERGAVSAGVMEWASVAGSVEDWMDVSVGAKESDGSHD